MGWFWPYLRLSVLHGAFECVSGLVWNDQMLDSDIWYWVDDGSCGCMMCDALPLSWIGNQICSYLFVYPADKQGYHVTISCLGSKCLGGFEGGGLGNHSLHELSCRQCLIADSANRLKHLVPRSRVT